MARPISFQPRDVDPRMESQPRPEGVPEEHAEAISAAYEVLQGLHDRGVLDMLRGALGSGEELLDLAVAAGKSPAAIRGTRNCVLLAQMLGAMEPEDLQVFTRSVPLALRTIARSSEPAGFWKLLMSFRRKEVRRGMAAVQAFLEAVGRSLADKGSP